MAMLLALAVMAATAAPGFAGNYYPGPVDVTYAIAGGRLASGVRMIYDGERYLRVIQIIRAQAGVADAAVRTDQLYDLKKNVGYLHSDTKHQWMPAPYLSGQLKKEFVWNWKQKPPFECKPRGTKKIDKYQCHCWSYIHDNTNGEICIDDKTGLIVAETESTVVATMTYKLLRFDFKKIEPRNYDLTASARK